MIIVINFSLIFFVLYFLIFILLIYLFIFLCHRNFLLLFQKFHYSLRYDFLEDLLFWYQIWVKKDLLFLFIFQYMCIKINLKDLWKQAKEISIWMMKFELKYWLEKWVCTIHIHRYYRYYLIHVAEWYNQLVFRDCFI